MELFRAQAFTVPTGTIGGARPAGAALAINDELRSTLGNALADVPPERQIQVAFRVDAAGDGERSNAVRALLLRFAFGDRALADAAASELADRLCDATDGRSHQSLMIVSAARDGERRQVSIWTFPQEAAFRFEPAQSLIQLLDDVFSQRSDLRKAASFEGVDRRDRFQTGWVVDLQAGSNTLIVADYWIRRFLDCELTISSQSGTRLLVRALRQAAETVTDPSARTQLSTAAGHLPHQPRNRMSLADVADLYLSGPAREAFGQALPNPELAQTPFELDRSILERGVQVQVFELHTGVRVSAPFGEIDQSVRIDGDTLSCTGRIVGQRLRSR